MEENYKVETIYLDNDNNIVEPEKATRTVIRELDKNGDLVRETWAKISNELEISNDDFDSYIEELEKQAEN